MAEGTIASISCYPIKSLGGTSLEATLIDGGGVLGDRRYAFLDLEAGQLCNAKHPRRFGRLLACTARYVQPPIAGVPLPPLEVAFPDGTIARNEGDALDKAMSRFLGCAVRLIDRLPESGARNVIVFDPDSGQDRVSVYARAVVDAHGDEVSTFDQRVNEAGTFVDLSPLHLVTSSTLELFRSLAPDANFDVRRYRPSLSIATDAPGRVEESWVGGVVRLGGEVEVDVVMPTPRCVMSTIEHAPDVPVDRNTLKAIVHHNSQEVPGGRGRWGCLGVYAEVRTSGTVHVGDPAVFLGSGLP